MNMRAVKLAARPNINAPCGLMGTLTIPHEEKARNRVMNKTNRDATLTFLIANRQPSTRKQRRITTRIMTEGIVNCCHLTP